MNDQYLFASAYNNLNNAHTNALLIYKKINDVWQFQQVLELGKPIDKSWPSLKFSLHGNQLMVGSYFTIGGGVSIVSLNSGTGSWEIKVHFGAGIFSGYGADVKLLDNHFFVGVPGYDYRGVLKSGAVFVYTKLPGEDWDVSMQPSAIIGAKIPIEGGYFGSSLDVIGNTLAVGAPGKFLTNDNQVRTVPGNTYIIQTQDYFWQTTNEFLNLQGDRYSADERDHFGSDVGIDENYFYIGSSSEHTERGAFSGAAYYIPTPPVIFLHPPVCVNSSNIKLTGYPFGGTWSGLGVDASGNFNPAETGVGSFLLTYATPTCSNEGKVLIEVRSAPVVEQVTPAEIKICSEGQVSLKVSSSENQGKYEWFYKSESAADFQSLGIGGPEKIVTNPGLYFARFHALCSTDSPVFTVIIEGVTLSVGPQNTVCAHHTITPLIISINSGSWSGTGVQNGVFNSGTLPNGTYKLSYRFTSPAGCDITVKDSIKINVVEPIAVIRENTDFCETGSILLKTNLTNPELEFTWYHALHETETRIPIQQQLGSTATVYERGYYHVSASNEDCDASSAPLEVGFSTDLAYTLTPEENASIEVCNQPEYAISVESRAGTEFTWSYTKDESETFNAIQSSTNQLMVKNDGYYKVSGQYGFCMFESAPVYMKFTNDSIFVPNVFTPNGDSKNPFFEVLTNSKVHSINVINRYGQSVFEVNKNQPWNGGDAPAGMYYWLILYQGCDGRNGSLKGWVQLVR